MYLVIYKPLWLSYQQVNYCDKPCNVNAIREAFIRSIRTSLNVNSTSIGTRAFKIESNRKNVTVWRLRIIQYRANANVKMYTEDF